MRELDARLQDAGYAFVTAPDLRAALEPSGPLTAWPSFADSWNHLEADAYRRSGDRRRRFAVFDIDPAGAIIRQPHQPHVQAPEYNALFGGIERWFAPMSEEVSGSDVMQTVLRFCDATFRACAPSAGRWRVEVHQFRIDARAGAPGEPTPEGVHRDGVDYVLVMLVRRENIVSGTTTVYDLRGNPLGSFTLSRAFDAALVDDHRVAHGVTPVAPQDPSRPGYRDVLVVTFKDEGTAPRASSVSAPR